MCVCWLAGECKEVTNAWTISAPRLREAKHFQDFSRRGSLCLLILTIIMTRATTTISIWYLLRCTKSSNNVKRDLRERTLWAGSSALTWLPLTPHRLRSLPRSSNISTSTLAFHRDRPKFKSHLRFWGSRSLLHSTRFDISPYRYRPYSRLMFARVGDPRKLETAPAFNSRRSQQDRTSQLAEANIPPESAQ